MASVLDAFVRFLGDTSQIEKDLGPGGKIDKAAGSGGQAAGNTLGSKMGNAVTKSFTAAGASAGYLFTAAAESGVAFEDQLRTINTVAGLTDEELAGVGDSIQALSRETGKGTDDLTAGFYDLVSAGVPAKDAIDVLRDSAILGTGALGTTAESVDLVTSAMNAYGLKAEDSGRITDIFAKAVADGKVTASELGSSLANVAPIAAQAGVSLEEVSAGYAVLTAKGTPAAQAATQMRAAISSLLTPNEQLNKIQKETGINFAELAKSKGLAVALDELRKSVGGNDEAFAKALGSIESYQFAVQVTGDNAEEFAGQIVETTDAQGIALAQYEEKSKSAAEQSKRLGATVNTFLQDMGGPFVGTIGPAVGALGQLSMGLGGLVSPARLAGGAIGGLAGKLTAGLTKGLGPKLITGLVGLVPAMAAGLGGVGSTIGGIIAAAIPIGMALLPVLIVGAIVAAIIFLANNPEIVDQLIKFGEDAVQFIVEGLGALIEALPGIFQAAFDAVVAALPGMINAVVGVILQIPTLLLELVPKIVGLFVTIGGRIVQLGLDMVAAYIGFMLSIPGRILGILPQIVGLFGQVAAGAIAKAGELAGTVAGFILSIPGRVVGWVGSLLGQAGNIVAGINSRISELAASVVRLILSVPGRIAGLAGTLFTFFGTIASNLTTTISTLVGNIVKFFMSIPGKIAALGGQIVSGIINGMASFPGKLANVIGNAFRNLKIDIGPFHISGSGVSIDLPKIELPNVGLPSFAVGTKYVPQDMIAQLHKGEIVLTREESEAFRRGEGYASEPPLTRRTAGDASEGWGGGDVHFHVPVQGALPVSDSGDIIEGLRSIGEAGVLPSLLGSPKYRTRGTRVGKHPPIPQGASS